MTELEIMIKHSVNSEKNANLSHKLICRKIIESVTSPWTLITVCWLVGASFFLVGRSVYHNFLKREVILPCSYHRIKYPHLFQIMVYFATLSVRPSVCLIYKLSNRPMTSDLIWSSTFYCVCFVWLFFWCVDSLRRDNSPVFLFLLCPYLLS